MKQPMPNYYDSASSHINNQLVKQGSITVDGETLTVFDKHDNSFDIHLIPETRRCNDFIIQKIRSTFRNRRFV